MPLGLLEGVLGGAGLFLLGMRFLSGGIRTVFDERLRRALSRLTSNRFNSFMFGIFLTLAFNSASAASIFVIGLANGGVLGLFQGINILGGAIIGASLSLSLPPFPYGLVSTPFIFVGAVLKLFARRRRYANAGELILGAGLLFLGLTILESSFKPYDTHPFYSAFGRFFLEDHLPTMLLGSITSIFVQSTQSFIRYADFLVVHGMMNQDAICGMTLGGVAGVALIALFASIGGASVSRRIAFFFFLTTMLVSVTQTFLYPFASVFYSTVGEFFGLSGFLDHAGLIYAVASCIIAMTVMLSSGVVSRFFGMREEVGVGVPQPCAGYIDMRIINTPALAIEQARKEISRMISVTIFMTADLREILFDFDARRVETVMRHEEVLDALNHEITSFLAQLAHRNSSVEASYEIPSFLQTVADLEHIGDRVIQLLGSVMKRKEAGVFFSDAAMEEIKKLADMVVEIISMVKASYDGEKIYSQKLHELKSEAKGIFERIRSSHHERICSGVCPPRTAIIYNEITESLIRIIEFCWNIIAVLGRKVT